MPEFKIIQNFSKNTPFLFWLFVLLFCYSLNQFYALLVVLPPAIYGIHILAICLIELWIF